MTFHAKLTRLREACVGRSPAKRGNPHEALILVRDLQELLHHFDRLDSEARIREAHKGNRLITSQELDREMATFCRSLSVVADLLKATRELCNKLPKMPSNLEGWHARKELQAVRDLMEKFNEN